VSAQPYYARRDDTGHYTFEGQRLESVTSILGRAPGGHLIKWSGQQTGLECAVYLVRAGIPTSDETILKLVGQDPDSRISLDQAYAGILDWRKRMLASENYRDFKGRIGSLTHHFTYSRALDLIEPDIATDKGALTRWLYNQTQKLDLFFKPSDPEWVPTEQMMDQLTESAYVYCLSADEWLRTAKPRFTTIGQEAMVVRTGCPSTDIADPRFVSALKREFDLTPNYYRMLPEQVKRLVCRRLQVRYAGTVDAHMILVRYEYGYDWAEDWPAQEVSLWTDFKTSNSLNHEQVQQQVAAYRAADLIVFLQSGEAVETHPLPISDFIGSLHIGPHAGALGLKTAFGTLDSKAKQLGCRLYTYPDDPAVLDSFYGLADHAHYQDNVPRSHQQRKRATEPKPPKLKPTDTRTPNFG